MRHFIIALWLVMLPYLSFAQEEQPAVNFRANKDSIYIGQAIKYTLTVTAKKDIEIDFSPLDKSFKDFVIKDSGDSVTGLWSKNKHVHWYLLTSYSVGTLTIPKTAILYRIKGGTEWKRLEVGEYKIEVKTALNKKEANSEIRDIRPPVPLRSFFYLYCLLAVIFVVAVIFFASKMIKQKYRVSALKAEIIPAHILAYEELERLKNKNYIATDRVKIYFDELSDIVRRYLENRFGLRAPEMTTEEFLNYVRGQSLLAQPHKQLLKEFLEKCDLVKFAKYHPSKEEIDSAFDSAKIFVDQTKE